MGDNFMLENGAELEEEEPFLTIQRIDSREIIYSPPKCKYVRKYVMGNKLGEGSYAKVKECLDSISLQRCAIKIMKFKTLQRITNGEQNVRQEIKLMQGLQHKNVIRLLDVFTEHDRGKIYMVMEYCVTCLQKMLDRSPQQKFPVWQAHQYFVQLVDGLEYLHSHGIIHKDIKPGNLLLTTNSTLKIIDFGVAEQIDVMAGSDRITTYQGSPMFHPPEVARGEKTFAGFKVDVWCTGCTLFKFATGVFPYDGENVFRLYDNISHRPVVFPDDLEEHLADLLRGMLTKEPDERITVNQIKNHSWCVKKHPRTQECATPVGEKDDCQLSTVIPYLRAKFCGSDDEEEDQDVHTLDDSFRSQTFGESQRLSREYRSGQFLEAGSATPNGAVTKPKKRKPTSCISMKSIGMSSCTQS